MAKQAGLPRWYPILVLSFWACTALWQEVLRPTGPDAEKHLLVRLLLAGIVIAQPGSFNCWKTDKRIVFRWSCDRRSEEGVSKRVTSCKAYWPNSDTLVEIADSRGEFGNDRFSSCHFGGSKIADSRGVRNFHDS